MINDSTIDRCVNFRCTIITTTTNLEQILIQNNITHPCKVTNDWEIAFIIYADIYLDNMRFRKDTLLTIIVKTGVFFLSFLELLSVLRGCLQVKHTLALFFIVFKTRGFSEIS